MVKVIFFLFPPWNDILLSVTSKVFQSHQRNLTFVSKSFSVSLGRNERSVYPPGVVNMLTFFKLIGKSLGLAQEKKKTQRLVILTSKLNLKSPYTTQWKCRDSCFQQTSMFVHQQKLMKKEHSSSDRIYRQSTFSFPVHCTCQSWRTSQLEGTSSYGPLSCSVPYATTIVLWVYCLSRRQ